MKEHQGFTWFNFWPTSTSNDKEIPLIKIWRYTSWCINTLTHTQSPTHNNSLTNTRNRENLAPYSKLENSHKYAAINLSISSSIFLSFLFNCRNTYVLFTHRASRLVVIALHQNCYES